MHHTYETYFANFVQHTNEKPVFIEEITTIIQQRRVQSMLDIGAGNGKLSIPLAQFVPSYLAVESNEAHIALLRSAGLQVIPEKFPCTFANTFDLVLASHVLSYQATNQRELVETAFEKVSAGGILLLITFRSNEKNEWTDLIEQLDIPVHEYYTAGYQELLAIVGRLGTFDVRKIRTEVRTDTIDDMAQALAFVASDGNAEAADGFLRKQSQLEQILSRQYIQGDQYVFPFDHFFIEVSK